MAGLKKRLSDELQEYIFGIFEMGFVAPKSVNAHVAKEKEKGIQFVYEDIPGVRQIRYLLTKFRNQKVAPLFQLGDLMD